MAKYKVTFPFIPSMGSVSPIIVGEYPSKQAEALWELNSMRDHDGLPRLKRLPAGVTFIRVRKTDTKEDVLTMPDYPAESDDQMKG